MSSFLTNRWIQYGIFAVLLGVGAGLLFYFNPAQESFFPPCPVYASTHLYCPGCGSLRALHALSHGHILVALRLNSLMVISIPILVWMWFRPAWMFRPKMPWIIFSILIGYGVLRNLPCWPFHLLAPH